MIPLHLHGGKPTLVKLEAAAFRISVRGEADRYVPLRRVSRVIVGGNVNIDSMSLLACADRGITVTFTARDGGVRARLVGRKDARSAFPEVLEGLLGRPGLDATYRQWFRGKELQAARECAERIALDPLPRRLERVRDRLWRAEDKLAGPHSAGNVRRFLRAMVVATVHEVLAGHGIDASRPALLGAVIDLPGDVARVVEYCVAVYRYQWLKESWKGNPSPLGHDRMKHLAIAAERLKPFIAGDAARLLRELHLFVLEVT